MSDDLGKKIKQITDILGQENMPDNIKGLLTLLASSSPNDNPPQNTELSPAKNEKADRSEIDENIEMIRKVKTVMDRVKKTHDPRINLLSAIKPFLNNNRQKKLGNCIMLLQMSNLTKFIDENDKINF